MHGSVGEGLADHLIRQDGVLPALKLTRIQPKAAWQVVEDGALELPQREQQRLTHVERGDETLVRIADPLGAGHADIVDAQRRHQAAERERLAEQYDAGDGRFQLPVGPA